jgi:hypothetical protein
MAVKHVGRDWEIRLASGEIFYFKEGGKIALQYGSQEGQLRRFFFPIRLEQVALR